MSVVQFRKSSSERRRGSLLELWRNRFNRWRRRAARYAYRCATEGETMKKYDDEPLLVAHLLGGRYGLEKVEDEGTMQEKVAYAIKVAREIRRQLVEIDEQPRLSHWTDPGGEAAFEVRSKLLKIAQEIHCAFRSDQRSPES
jgi:hypothetical protein